MGGNGAAGAPGTGGTGVGCGDASSQVVSGLFALSGRYAVEAFTQFCDVDGDGQLDMVSITSSSLTVRRGRGDGTFIATPVITSTQYPFSGAVYVGDFDGDHRCDIFTAPASTTSNVSTARGMADATFLVQAGGSIGTTAMPIAEIQAIGAADLRNNGAFETISLGWTGAFPGTTPVQIFPCSSNCRDLSTTTIVGSRGTVYGGAVGPVDGDAFPDILMSMLFQTASGPPTPQFAFFKGVGDGTFGAATKIAALAGWVPHLIRDLDGDGYSDVSTQASDNSGYRVFWGDAQGTFTASSPLYGDTPADFDGDGKLDLAMNSSVHCISFGAGARVFGQRVLISPVALGPFRDFNKDGADDIATSDASNVVSIFLSTAKQAFVGPPDIQCGAVACTGPTGF